MAAAKVQPSFWEKLDIIPAQLALIGTLVQSAITGFFRGNSGVASYKHHVTHAVLRKLLSRLSTVQLRYLKPSFRTYYEKFCEEKQMKTNVVTFKSGFEAFWMGDPSAKYVFIYFHGGGYALDGDDYHLKFYHSVQEDLAAAGVSVAWLFVAYSLTPNHKYPTQICEAVEALNHVLEERNRSPSEIIIGGDSAGAALALAVLSHLSHPSPGFPAVKMDKKVKAAIVMAPWVSFRFDWPSFKSNEFKDCISITRLKTWAATYTSQQSSNNYIEAVEAPANWWVGVQAEQLLCTAGGDEILLDSISEWVGKYKSANPETTTFVVGKNEAHIAPIVEPQMMDNTETEQGRAIKAWLKARL